MKQWNTNSKHVSIKNNKQIKCYHTNSIQIKAKKSLHSIVKTIVILHITKHSNYNISNISIEKLIEI